MVGTPGQLHYDVKVTHRELCASIPITISKVNVR